MRIRTSPTEPAAREVGTGPGDGLIVFAGADGRPGRWLLVADGAPVAAGDGPESLGEAGPPLRTILAVPGTDVAVRWLDLPDGLSSAQAAAAARLAIAGETAEPVEALHVAVGGEEEGLRCVAWTSAERMAGWLAAAAEAGIEPDMVVPAPLLLAAPESGLARRGEDHRGRAEAFSAEPALAEALAAGRAVTETGALAAAPPPIDLRQGPFARRRAWRIERRRLRRIGLLLVISALLALGLRIAELASHAFAADRIEAEAAALAAEGGAARLAALRGAGAGYSATSAALFEAVRATGGVELSRIAWRPDGTLLATVHAESPASLAALAGRLEAAGFKAEPGPARSGGGRTVAELTVRRR